MDPLTEDFSRPEEMTMLTQEDISEENIDTSDDVEHLQHSFLEAVHDENIQPKMQCLMMDSSFSMVTVQGEDSGIEWETSPSRSATPWSSEAGNLSGDSSTPAMGPASSGTYPAGKIIFVMDEEFILKQKKTKERGQGAKGKGDMHKGILLGSSDNVSGRPELVSFSEPNVKLDSEEFEEQIADPSEDKEQKLFRLVSEGSEILNIIVPSKVATVDEEESNEMLDNLSYLEASAVSKAHEEIHKQIIELQNEGLPTAEIALAVQPPVGRASMHPPGAPVPKSSTREHVSNVDYFEAFTLIEAPGGPAVLEQEQKKAEEAPPRSEGDLSHAKGTCNSTLSLDETNAEKMSLVEITSELLDDVFYGNTDNYCKTTDRSGDNKRKPPRLSLKSTGSILFGSQEDVLTPIYLPEGPPKIIDQILLEEPKAMAFLYTDLYEEATGSRKKEEDTESVSSEKSFHSRHSDREARGYLEKYVLIDETPALEVEQIEKVQCPEGSSRTLTQDLYEFGDMAVSKPDVLLPDEEVTDFFRSSANSSPCALEPLSRLAEDDEAQTATKDKAKTTKKVVIVAEKVSDCPIDSLSESPIHDADWERTFDDTPSGHEEVGFVHQQPIQQYTDMKLPVAPPRKKASSLQKSCLDLAPLTPVNTQEETEIGPKEAREEEKETADGEDIEETSKSLSEATFPQETMPSDETSDTTDGLNKPETEVTVSASRDEGSTTLGEKNETLEQNDPEGADQVSTELTNEETSNDPVKGKGQCIIL